MVAHVLVQLAAVIRREREELLAQWRQLVRKLPSARGLDVPTLNDHMPKLLDEMASALEADTDQTMPENLVDGSPPEHGMQRVEDGFDVIEVVAEYNILRGCIHDVATANRLELQGQPFHVINRVLDEAIGLAVHTFAAQQALEVRRRREEYLAFVAHDLRTPLNAIALAVRVLELQHPRGTASAPTTRMLHSLQRSTRQLEALVTKVMEETEHVEAAGGLKVERRTFDLWPVVESLVQDLQPVARTSSTRLRNEVPEDLTAYADAALIKRILQNLLANALRHTPRGLVTIEARELFAGLGVECTVRDDGEGIAPDFITKIFDKGESNPDGEGGTGLGLAIVKTFVEAHGGTVAVESKEGQGSTFRFMLPAKSE